MLKDVYFIKIIVRRIHEYEVH